MKKIACFILASAMILGSLTACSSKKNDSSATSGDLNSNGGSSAMSDDVSSAASSNISSVPSSSGTVSSQPEAPKYPETLDAYKYMKSKILRDYIENDKKAAETLIKKSELYLAEDNPDNLSRIARVFEKLMKGEKVVIAAIGGSITAGSGAANSSESYSNQLYLWFKEVFPKCDIRYVNAGFPATASNYGVHRVDAEILKEKPDFVVVDFSVNDWNNQNIKEMYESLIRKIMNSENKPGVMHIAFARDKVGNVQKMHLDICKNYGVPLISYQDAVLNEIKNTKKLTFNNGENAIHTDTVHPNSHGHRLAADLLIYQLIKIYNNRKNYKSENLELPKPVTANRYMDAHILNNTNIEPTENTGFKKEAKTFWAKSLEKGWASSKQGDKITFKIKTINLYMAHLQLNKPNSASKVRVTVDGKPLKNDISGKNPQRPADDNYGYIVFSPIIENGREKKEHTVTIEVIKGDLFQFAGLLVS